ncbi:MAG: M23 family metallopeptidase [Vulcanibacillus sp.]
MNLKTVMLLKEYWKEILMFFLVFISLFFLLIAASIGFLFPSSEPSLVDEYKDVAKEIDIDWAEMLIYDTVNLNNDFRSVNTSTITDTALLFLDLYVIEYEYVTFKYYDQFKDEYEYFEGWVTKSVSVFTGNNIKSFLSSRSFNINSIKDIMNGIESLNSTEQYDLSITYRGFETVISRLNDNQQEWAKELWVSNAVYNMYGEYIELPDHIDVQANGYFAWPTPSLNSITSNFGLREDPISGETEYHSGIDISGANAFGQAIISISGGVVINKGSSALEGNFVTIEHEIDGETWTSTYCHLSQINVNLGDEVKQGDVLGAVGSTGRSTGPHLHLTLKWNGRLVNPLDYL